MTNSPPQFGHLFSRTFSAQATQKVHSNEQNRASPESAGKSLSQHSQLGLSSSMGTSLIHPIVECRLHGPTSAKMSIMPLPLILFLSATRSPLSCLHETQQSNQGMRIAASAFALATMLGAAMLFASRINGDWASTAVMVGTGFCLAVIFLLLGVRVRNRLRRRLSDMRDSALW